MPWPRGLHSADRLDLLSDPRSKGLREGERRHTARGVQRASSLPRALRCRQDVHCRSFPAACPLLVLRRRCEAELWTEFEPSPPEERESLFSRPVDPRREVATEVKEAREKDESSSDPLRGEPGEPKRPADEVRAQHHGYKRRH